MKSWVSIILIFFCASSQLFAQDGLVTHNDFTTQTLVTDIFASGACENIDLILPIGNTNGIGYFENASDIIGLNNGIILSTGPTHYSNGPNNKTNTSGNFNDNSGDPDLNRLATASVFDAVGIEFDFVPLDSFVSFRYVFASEEYCEFVGSQYNDVFGFFISGPGINGTFSNHAENVALIPGSTDFVAINSVNFNQHSQWYVHNERPDDLDNCNLNNVSSTHLNEIEYDGFTAVMTAIVKLHPCESYHIRLVVGDVSDAFYDSAVFLEAGSFNLGGQIGVEAISDAAGTGRVYEGCEDGYFRFTRTPESPIEFPLSVNYHISEASTATPGEDYTALSGTMTIPAGYEYADLPFFSLNDNEEEGEELVRLILDIPCACYADSADLVILPSPIIESNLQDAYACPEALANLSVQLEGGIAPYSYQWSNGGEQAEQQVIAIEGQLHYVTIADACGHSIIDSAYIWLSAPPEAFLSGEQSICQGDTAWLNLDLNGVPPFTLSYRVDTGDIQYVEIENDPIFPAIEGGQFTLLTVEDAACLAVAQGVATVTLWEVAADIAIQNPLCAGESNGSISINTTVGQAPFLYYLNDENQENTIQGLVEGLYHIEVVDNRNCRAFYVEELIDPPVLQTPFVDCEALSLGRFMPKAQGGTPPYQYSIDGDNWLGANWYENLLGGEEIQLQIKDENACYLEESWFYPISFPDGMFAFPPFLEIPLGSQLPLKLEWLIPLDFIRSVQWLPADQLSCSDCIEPVISARIDQSINILVTNIFGCKYEQWLDIKVDDRLDVFIPNAFSPNGDDNNDLWHIYANPLQVERIEELHIFDRWGNHIFHATDWPINSDRHGWDGRYRGQLLDPSVFAYSITFLLVNGESKTIGGGVVLVR